MDTTVIVQELDVSLQGSVEAAFQAVQESIGPVDIVVNAAGHLSEAGTLTGTSVSNFWNSFEVNTKGTFLVSQSFLRHCPKANGTQQVLIILSSLIVHFATFQNQTAPASYAISKLANAKLAEYIAHENSEHLRAYDIQPDIIETEMSNRSLEMASPSVRDSIIWDHVDLSAHFIAWLASQRGTAIPSGKFLWVNWDVDELEARSHELKVDPFLLTMTLGGWPFEGKKRV